MMDAKKFCLVTSIVLLTILFCCCKSKTIYVPIERIKKEYIDRQIRDSIHIHDSILVKMMGDTVWFEKYKTIYKNKLVRDSIYICDTISVPYKVIEEVQVNVISPWQKIQIWCGRVLLFILMGWGFIKTKAYKRIF